MGIFRGTGGTGDSTTDTTVTTVTQKAAEAASSATSAANSATSAANSASSASTSEANAATSETNSANSATASATSATASETAKTAAQAAQTAAETAKTNAETAEANAVTAKNQAVSAKDNAVTAQTAAETAETNAETAYANTLAIYGSTTDVQNAVNSASTSATNAATSATQAATSATNAANSATSAGTSETNAASSASQAATSAASANSYATDAQTAQTAAETAQAAAEAAEYNINGLYLGSLANDPTLDGNGVAVTTGDLYFNTTEQEVRVYTDGDVWEPVVDLAGDITVNSLTSNNNVVVKGNLEVQGTTITVDSATAQTIDLGDNDKIRLGDTDDLQIYHDGTDSYIANTTGTLKLSGNTDVTGNITVSGTVDGRDIAADGTTLDAVASTYVDVSGDTMTGNLNFNDSVQARYGASGDLRIYHDGSHSYISDQGPGNLRLVSNGNSIRLETNDENMLIANNNSSVDIYYDGAKKFATTSSGVDITGTVVADELKIDSGVFDINLQGSLDALPADNDESHIFTTSGLGSGFFSKFGALGLSSRNKDTSSSDIGFFTDKIQRLEIADGGYIYFLEDTGTTAKLTWDASAEELQFKDNVKAKFGDGGDLQIYHDGVDTWITESGVGSLIIKGNYVQLQSPQGEMFINNVANGAVTLYYDNSAKLATTSTGIDVTGTVTADDSVLIEGGVAQLILNETDVSQGNSALINSGGQFSIRYRSDDGNTTTRRLAIDNNGGDISFYDDTGTSQDFYWDASTSRLGLGTTTPAVSLDVRGDGTFYSGANTTFTVGNGLSSGESSTFDLKASYDGNRIFNFKRATTIESRIISDSSEHLNIDFNRSATADFRIRRGSGNVKVSEFYSTGDIAFFDDSGASKDFYWDASTSRLGLGTTSPAQTLDVSGTARFNSLNVDGSSNRYIYITSSDGLGECELRLGDVSDTDAGSIAYDNATNSMQFRANAAERMRIDSSGNVGIGTTSPIAELTVGSPSSTNVYSVVYGKAVVADTDVTLSTIQAGALDILGTSKAAVGRGPALTFSQNTSQFVDGYDRVIGAIQTELVNSNNLSSNSAMLFYTSDGSTPSTSLTEKMRLDNKGRLGIGTTSPSTTLSISSASANGINLEVDQNNSALSSRLMLSTGTSGQSTTLINKSGALAFQTGATPGTDSGSEVMRIDSSGNLLVGKTVANTNTTGIQLNPNSLTAFTRDGDHTVRFNRLTSDGDIFIFQKDATTAGSIGNSGTLAYINGTGGLIFKEGGSEAARIDSSGNLLVGTTAEFGNGGITLNNSGLLYVDRDGNKAAVFSRRTSDGAIVDFVKDGTTVGSIGAKSGDLYIGTGDVGLKFSDQYDTIHSVRGDTGADLNGAVDLGRSNVRWRNLYLSEGVRADTLKFSSLAGSEYGRFDSSGNLLVGGTTTGANTSTTLYSGGLAQHRTTDAKAIVLDRSSSDGDIAEFRKDGNTIGSIGVDNTDNIFLSGNSSHSGLMAGSSGIIPYANGSISDATEDLGQSGIRWRNLYLSGGVYLGGTGSANLLDDYEEGTWTPSLSASTTSDFTLNGGERGVYTKVGNQVTVHGILQISSLGTSSGNMSITGLPFTVANSLVTTSFEASGNIGVFANMSSAVSALSLIAVDGTTSADFQKVSGASATATSGLAVSDVTSSFTIRFTLTYFA